MSYRKALNWSRLVYDAECKGFFLVVYIIGPSPLADHLACAAECRFLFYGYKKGAKDIGLTGFDSVVPGGMLSVEI